MKIDDVLTELGFKETHYVQGRATVADLFRPKNRCGIYVLHFADGMYYVGQSIDVTRRYHDHRRNHDDLVYISFRRVSKKRLDDEENATVKAVEKARFRLRNINLVSVTYGDSDFDLVMSPEEQAYWLDDLDHTDLEGERFNEPDLRSKYTKKFHRYQKMPCSDEVTRVLREYVMKGIPAIKRGEMSFWALSCLPKERRDIVVYARTNINWQEVLTAFELKNEVSKSLPSRVFRQPTTRLGFSFHLALSPLQNVFSTSLSGLVKRYPAMDVKAIDHRYDPGGHDQITIEVFGSQDALKLLNDTDILKAIRLFNLRLMRKGPCIYGRYHCFDLADLLVCDFDP